MIPERIPAKDLIHQPKAAEAHVTSSIARQGMIGQCLQEALHDILAEDKEAAAAVLSNKEKGKGDDENGKNDDDDASDTTGQQQSAMIKMQLNQQMVEQVMKEFGQAVARTKYHPTEASSSQPPSANNTETNNQKASPPAALLRGRVDHYNRFNGKWRIVVQGVQLKRRVALARNRKKNPKPTLWDATEDNHQETTLSASVQILAYDDLS